MASVMRVEQLRESGVIPLRQRPLDLVHLARQSLGDPGIEAEVLRIFQTRIRVYRDRLEASTKPEELSLNLFAILGASAGVGAWGVADLARLTEAEINSGLPINPERVDDISLAIEEVCTFIGTIIEDEPTH